jgi:hypothetical protein
MDPFEDDPAELTGSLISLEFGLGGRVSQLWAADPALPEEGEEFQFVLAPIQFGEESAEDYLPGTILIGARNGPDQPWISSRNGAASQVAPPPNRPVGSVEFEYDFPFLDDLAATGSWFELPGATAQIVWDVTVKNRGRQSIEIGELAFPMAFNNLYDGFGWSDEQLRRLWQSRVYVHKFIGGAASWMFVQRMTAEPPGLLVFPGDNTGWEFWSHVPASLNAPYQWDGIPVVYAHSRATLEREKWDDWMNEHTSLILEPGDSRSFQTRFVACESDKQDGIHQTLVSCGRTSVRLLPSAVAPTSVGIGVEITGASPRSVELSRPAQVELDSDEEGTFCLVRAETPGPVRLTFHDAHGQPCHTHLMFTDPIRTLVERRAEWICKHQVVDEPGSAFYGAVLLTNIRSGEPVTDPEEYTDASGIECSLADALFLAEKNAVYPDRAQIQVVDRYIGEFLLARVQNPADHAVASSIDSQSGVGAYFGRPLVYPHVFNLYHSMYRVARSYGETRLEATEYLVHAAATAKAMFEQGWRLYVRTVGVLGFARAHDLLADLRAERLNEEAEAVRAVLEAKSAELAKLSYPYAGESALDTSGMEDVVAAAKYLADDEHLERSVRCAFAARSPSPSWWWYGSDKRIWDGADSTPIQALVDKGEACLAHTTIPNSQIFFGLMDRDYLALPEAYMRMAFGGMMGPWALVRRDGAAAMCFCPDWASKQAGFNAYTGAGGLGYYHYLRCAGSFVLPNRTVGATAFGCHFEVGEDAYVVRPWDSVGRRVSMRQIGFDLGLTFGCLQQLRLDLGKRWFEAQVENPSDKDVRTRLSVRGLWGEQVRAGSQLTEAVDGTVWLEAVLPARRVATIRGEVV